MAMSRALRSSPGPAGRLDRLLCGLRGHFMLMRFDPDRLSLCCALCGHRSPGWEIGARRGSAGPVRSYHDARFDRRSRPGPEARPAAALGM